ncbi:MAG TPA: ComEC/Rec2 family competence protein [Candidatus Moranbacteria bacterium]|nr:ComEC/Rec2 family competence protein [Candidatus Moranbacteria bacterium]
MPNRKALYSILLFLTLLAVILAGIIYYERSREIKVVFFDVGQGDAILIEQGSKQILIDGGPDGQKILEKLGEEIPFWDRNIELVIATHPDEDHIDGLIDVMNNYQIGQLIDNGVETETQVYKKYREARERKSINYSEGKADMEIKISENINLNILSPDGSQEKNHPKDTNISSIVSRLTVGENSFLLVGDLTMEGEKNLTDKKVNLESRFLKVGHHGSKYSTSKEFLEAVKPKEVVISVGKNNRFGHPAAETLERIKLYNVTIKRTDEAGNVEYEF